MHIGEITIEKMEFYAGHGHFPAEAIVGNNFEVDLKMKVEMGAAAESDELDDAVDYQKAFQIVSREMKINSKLMEHLAKRILNALKSEIDGIIEAEIKISKMHPPMGGQMRCVAVTMKS